MRPGAKGPATPVPAGAETAKRGRSASNPLAETRATNGRSGRLPLCEDAVDDCNAPPATTSDAILQRPLDVDSRRRLKRLKRAMSGHSQTARRAGQVDQSHSSVIGLRLASFGSTALDYKWRLRAGICATLSNA